MSFPVNSVLQGHVLDRLHELPDDLVDVVCCSPPYWGLRDYGVDCVAVWDGKPDCNHVWGETHLPAGYRSNENRNSETLTSEANTRRDTWQPSSSCIICGAWKGQLGLEPHPDMYIQHLAEVFAEVKRVLKPSGSLWLNLGDTYFGGNGKAGRNKLKSSWLQPKQKMLIPERVAIALQEQGWILRNTVVWNKVNHMPSSVRDRFTVAHENVYFFVKSPQYYFDLDAVRREYIVGENGKRNNKQNKWTGNSNSPLLNHAGVKVNPSGANPGDVWSLTNEGLKDEHFAAFPQKLVKRILECAAPREICNRCGQPRMRITHKIGYVEGNGGHVCRKIISTQPKMGESSIFRTQANNIVRQEVGWSDCGCNAGFHSAVVLDPFAGAGTTLLVAHKMGFDWLGIELVPKYCGIIERRIAKHGRVRLDKFVSAPAERVLVTGENKNE